MVLMLDGSTDYLAYVKSDLYNVFCLRYLFTSIEALNLKKKKMSKYLYTYTSCSELPSNLSTMVPTLDLLYMVRQPIEYSSNSPNMPPGLPVFRRWFLENKEFS